MITMSVFRSFFIIMLVGTFGFLYWFILNLEKKTSNDINSKKEVPYNITPKEILRNGNGIIFVETTDRMQPTSLELCAVESAARIYPDRPIAFFMKGLPDISSIEDEDRAKNRFPTLSSHDNIYLFPLRLEEVFRSTPLLPWYKKVNPNKEVYWTHVSSDGSRLALIWKYGGIYMDTDIISICPVPLTNFLVAEAPRFSSNGVFGLSANHTFSWKSMEDFVQNYNGAVWGYQGPNLFTRILKKFFCDIPEFKSKEDIMCGNITFTNPDRFYPIRGPTWKRYFEVWDKNPTFNSSYGLHFFNFANKEHYTMVPGSKTLADHLYQQYCPSTYDAIIRHKSTYL
ncbi:alpha-1,4-N-acetylglucosaminyltransferase [Xenopus laevis]|uniref:Alpha 1,4-glycosyltransferase domain-containing protein n=2 Tax=Xenopus laevis TaxID=8355 RepID=A0A974HI98_XENLA|nr:alpha-1,4-N-acetylglucosaminyltransferase [Xenopus laevis]OCT78905.1 hypothetical protein XELAEV_18029994mg [Xenopus laevis]